MIHQFCSSYSLQKKVIWLAPGGIAMANSGEGKNDILVKLGILLTILTILLMIFTLLFGDNIYQQIFGQPVFSRAIPSPVSSFTNNIPKITEGVRVVSPQTTILASVPVHTITPVSPTSKPTQLPSPTTINTPGTPEIILFEADWSNGFGGWGGSPDWKVVNNMLVNDGTGFPGFILSPYNPGENDISDYAVEAEIQVIGTIQSNFGIIARWIEDDESPSNGSGYWFGRGFLPLWGIDYHIFVTARTPGIYDPVAYIVLEPDEKWHTYRVEVSGNEMRYLIDGVERLHGSDNKFLEGGEIRLWSSNTSINVRNFKIIALLTTTME